MGSSASKGARAAGSAARKYPTHVSRPTNAPPFAPPPGQDVRPSPTVHPKALASELRNGGMLNRPSDTTALLHPFPPVDESQHSALIPNLPATNLDAEDPAFAAQLRSLGAVQPNPHFSPTSTSPLDPQRNTSTTRPSNPSSPYPPSAFPDPRTNPALMVLQARQRLQEEAEEEFLNVGRKGFPGRRFVDVSTVRQALLLRQKGEGEEDVERKLGFRKGRLGVLGKGFVEGV